MTITVNQLYDVPSNRIFHDSGIKVLKKEGLFPENVMVSYTDASSGVVQRRSLEVIDPTVLSIAYPENAFLNSGLGINNFGGYAEQVTSLRTRAQGAFRKSSDKNSNKGRISVSGEKSTISVEEFDAQELWTDTEVEQAKLEKRNVVSEYMQATDRIYKEDLDEQMATGIDGVNGLLNHSDITPAALTAITDASTAKSDYETIAEFIRLQHSAVNNTPEYMANTFVMPISTYNIIMTKQMDTATNDRSVLRALMTNFGGIQFKNSWRCEDVGGVKRAGLFSTSDKVMKFRVPVPMKRSAVFVQGFKYMADVKFRSAGIDLLETSGLVIGTGI